MTHKAAAKPTTKSPGGKDHTSFSTLALDLLDTAWRIAVPVVLLAGIGIIIDNKLHFGPICTIVGTIIGFVGAGFLIQSQLRAIEQDEVTIKKEKDTQ